MSYGRVPGYRRYKSAYETRRMREATRLLEEDTSMLDDEIYSHQPDFNFDKPFLVSDRKEDLDGDWCSPVTNQDCLDALVEEHFQYQDFAVKNIPLLRKLISKRIIDEYFEAVKRFDQRVHSIDPTYPILIQANF